MAKPTAIGRQLLPEVVNMQKRKCSNGSNTPSAVSLWSNYEEQKHRHSQKPQFTADSEWNASSCENSLKLTKRIID